MSRWKSPVLRTALVALILFVIKRFSLDIPSELVSSTIDAMLVLIFGVGIINNPTDKENL